MSSLRDIMDVDDIDPLEAQAHRRSRATAQQQASSQPERSSTLPFPQVAESVEPPSKRRRSDRESEKSTSPASLTAPNSEIARRQRGGALPSMEGYGYEQNFVQQAGSSRSGRRSSRASDMAESPVRLTPVTGRVSRAKKGHPVHVCEQCTPPRVFTRAEHLRRHQLGHEKPKYPCTFEDCEKAFHRPDLLTRHMLRHDAGEDAFKASDRRSRSDSSSSESHPSSPRPETLLPVRADANSSYPQSPGGSSQQPTSNPSRYPGPSSTQDSLKLESAFDRPDLGSGSQFPSTPSNRHHQASFSNTSQPPRERSLYDEPADDFIAAADNAVPLGVQIPPEGIAPGLSNTNSPFYSSEDTYSATPSDVSGFPSLFPPDAILADVGNAEWDPTWPMDQARTNLRSPGLDIQAGSYERNTFTSPPYFSPPPVTTTYPNFRVSGPFVGYQTTPPGPAGFSNAQKVTTLSSPARSPQMSRMDLPGHPGNQVSILGPISHLVSPISKSRPAPSMDQINQYVGYYFNHIEPKFPTTHAGIIDQPNEMLRNAMAALGAQFGPSPEDRRISAKLHEICRGMIASITELNDFQTMQAVVLTELFARYRAKRADASFSNQFKLCYRILLCSGSQDSFSVFADLRSGMINAEIERRLKNRRLHGLTADRQHTIDSLWHEWIEYETRQRLRSVCFVLDVHQQRFFGQRRCQPSVNSDTHHLVLPCPEQFWNATNSNAWYDEVFRNDCSSTSISIAENWAPSKMSQQTTSVQLLTLCSLASRLPAKADSTATTPVAKILNHFPDCVIGHAYLALLYTPLHQLLALTGSTYVFGRKLTSHKEINEIEPRIKAWSSSPEAAEATWYACHVLRLALSTPPEAQESSVCEYWAIYTSVLICWAFGHRASKLKCQSSWSSSPASMQSIAKANSERRQVSRDSSCTLEASEEGFDGKNEMLGLVWLQTMIEMGSHEMMTCGIKGETKALLCAVKAKLDSEDLGGKGMCAMMLDSCGVLGKLIEGEITF